MYPFLSSLSFFPRFNDNFKFVLIIFINILYFHHNQYIYIETYLKLIYFHHSLTMYYLLCMFLKNSVLYNNFGRFLKIICCICNFDFFKRYIVWYAFSPADGDLSCFHLFPIIVRPCFSQVECKQFHTTSTSNKAICGCDKSGQKAGVLYNHVWK